MDGKSGDGFLPLTSAPVDNEDDSSTSAGSTLGRLSGFQKHALRRPRERVASVDSGQQTIANTSKYLRAKKNFPLHRYVMIWTLGLSLCCGLIVWIIEGGKYSLWKCVFLGVSCVTCSGLSAINLLALSSPSLVALTVATLLGSSVLRSLLPVAVRMYYLEARIPRNLRTFDLAKFKKLPLWIVEYKSLQIIIRIVAAYQVLFMGLGFLALWGAAEVLGDDKVLYDPDRQLGAHHRTHASAAGFAAFTSVSAFANCGLGLRPDWRGESQWPLTPQQRKVIMTLSHALALLRMSA